MNSNILINGHSLDQINILDRGLQYGDGVFETITICDGQPLLWQQHLDRLFSGCQRLQLSEPTEEILLEEIETLCSHSDKAVCKIIVTRGAGGRGYAVSDGMKTSRVIACYDWPEYPNGMRQDGVSIRVCEFRLGWNPGLSGIKHLNRLEQVIARNEWQESEIFEGLVLDIEDNLIEATMSNVFLLQDNHLLTPDLSRCGIAGVVRDVIINYARELGFDVAVKDLSIDDVYQCDEIFLTNSLIGVCPVREINGTHFKYHEHAYKFTDYLLQKKMIAPL